ALPSRCPAHMRSFVRLPHVQRCTIGIGVDGHGPDSHFAQRPDHAQANFAAIGDEDFSKHPSSIVTGPFNCRPRSATIPEVKAQCLFLLILAAASCCAEEY